MGHEAFKDALQSAVNTIRNKDIPLDYLYFFTGGTGLPDDACIDYFKDMKHVVVVTRDNKKYLAGKLMEEQNGG